MCTFCLLWVKSGYTQREFQTSGLVANNYSCRLHAIVIQNAKCDYDPRTDVFTTTTVTMEKIYESVSRDEDFKGVFPIHSVLNVNRLRNLDNLTVN